MAIITCPDCQAEVSDQAKACAKCGRPLRVKPRRHVAGATLGVLLGGFALLSAPFSAIGIGAVALIAPTLSTVTALGALVTLVGNVALLVGSIMVFAGYDPHVARTALWSMIGWAAIAAAAVLPTLFALPDAQMRAGAIAGFVGSMIATLLINGVLLVLFRGDERIEEAGAGGVPEPDLQ